MSRPLPQPIYQCFSSSLRGELVGELVGLFIRGIGWGAGGEKKLGGRRVVGSSRPGT